MRGGEVCCEKACQAQIMKQYTSKLSIQRFPYWIHTTLKHKQYYFFYKNIDCIIVSITLLMMLLLLCNFLYHRLLVTVSTINTEIYIGN